MPPARRPATCCVTSTLLRPAPVKTKNCTYFRCCWAGAPSVVALVRQFQQDHVHMAADWAAARGALAALADGSAAGLSAQDEALLDQFAQRYGQHIQAEEGTAYPSAQALWARATCAPWAEMAGRRRAS